MFFQEALKIIESKFKTIKESDHNKIIITNKTYDGSNGFCVSIYNKDNIAILTDLGVTKDIFDEVLEEEWIKHCKKFGFSFNHWSIVKEFNELNDLYKYIEFLDIISNIYNKI